MADLALIKILTGALGQGMANLVLATKVGLCMLLSVASGIMEIVVMGTTAGSGTCAGLARRQASLVSVTGRPHMLAPVTSETRQSRSGSTSHMDILGKVGESLGS